MEGALNNEIVHGLRNRVIPNTKAGNHKGNRSWMEGQDLVLSVKDLVKKACESKCSCQWLTISVGSLHEIRYRF